MFPNWTFSHYPASSTLWSEVIRILPSVLWFLLVTFVVARFYRQIKEQVLPRLSGIEFGGVKLSLVEASIDAAIELGTSTHSWKVDVTDTQKKRAMDRVKVHWRVFQKATFLWLDDHPENNINERKLFRKLGVTIDIATTNQEALELAVRGDHDLIISDIGRDQQDETGLDFLEQLQKKGVPTPLIFYVGTAKPGVPPGAFGLTALPTELLELTMDVLRDPS